MIAGVGINLLKGGVENTCLIHRANQQLANGRCRYLRNRDPKKTKVTNDRSPEAMSREPH
jgi:hypothetical protein